MMPQRAGRRKQAAWNGGPAIAFPWCVATKPRFAIAVFRMVLQPAVAAGATWPGAVVAFERYIMIDIVSAVIIIRLALAFSKSGRGDSIEPDLLFDPTLGAGQRHELVQITVRR